MLEFNNNHIFTGYLKQLLASFNLPTARVYTMEQYNYAKNNIVELNVFSSIHRNTNIREIADSYSENTGIRYLPYIKDNILQEYVKATDGSYSWKKINTDYEYYYNQKIPNFTKNLKIKDNVYDYYTHEYLGKYLRFQRDYHDINLMPLYNCFSNRICSNLDISFKIDNNTDNNSNIITFNSADTKYKIYMVPVKFFQKYTIAIDSDLPVEFCCWFYNKYQRKFSETDAEALDFIKNSYFCAKSLQFNLPIIYSKLFTKPDNFSSTSEYQTVIEKLSKWALLEDDLKLFIKVPFSNTSTITVLEGDYLNYNDKIFDYVLDVNQDDSSNSYEYIKYWEIKANHWITNYAEGGIYAPVNDRNFKPITFLQLLGMNTGKSYPFADRLIEYLLGNVITNYDSIGDNIARVQEVMSLNEHYSENIGLWENKIRPIMYDYINNHTVTQVSKVNHDILGYIDKDVEKFYSGYKWTKDGFKKVTISTVDLYPELYNKDTK